MTNFATVKIERKNMKTNKAGIELIKKYEGCRLTAYKCPAGVLTIGYGHTAGVKAGDKITQEQANAYLQSDIIQYEELVNECNKKYKYNFNRNQFSALVSFAFNCGGGNLSMLLQNGKRDKQTISQKMLLYCIANGQKLKGLQDRRKAEQDLYNTEVLNNGRKKDKE